MPAANFEINPVKDAIIILKSYLPAPLKEHVRKGRAYVRLSPFWCTYVTPIGAAANALPNLVLVGAQKSGTSSFHYYFSQHPRVRPPKHKEIHYFNREYRYGTRWYRAHFCKKRLVADGCITFEATPDYMFHVLAPRRMAAELPEVKIVILLRNPADRAYSHYWHERSQGVELSSFEEALRLEGERLEGEEHRVLNNPEYFSFNLQHYSYVDRGLYVKHIGRWLAHFARSRVLFMKSEALAADPQGQMERAFEFAGLDPCNNIDWKRQHLGRYRERMDRHTRNSLVEMFQEANRELPDIAGDEFEWSTKDV